MAFLSLYILCSFASTKPSSSWEKRKLSEILFFPQVDKNPEHEPNENYCLGVCLQGIVAILIHPILETLVLPKIMARTSFLLTFMHGPLCSAHTTTGTAHWFYSDWKVNEFSSDQFWVASLYICNATACVYFPCRRYTLLNNVSLIVCKQICVTETKFCAAAGLVSHRVTFYYTGSWTESLENPGKSYEFRSQSK